MKGEWSEEGKRGKRKGLKVCWKEVKGSVGYKHLRIEFNIYILHDARRTNDESYLQLLAPSTVCI